MDLESYLKHCVSAQPSKNITLDAYTNLVESFCSENLNLFHITESIYRNVLVRDEGNGQYFGRVSFAGTEPSLAILRILSRNTYHRDPKTNRTAFINTAEYLSLRFGKTVRATLMTYEHTNNDYRLRYGVWSFSGRDVLTPREQDFREMYLKLENGRLVRDRMKDLRVRLGHRR